MISPFIFLGFIIRRPTKRNTKIVTLPPEEHTTTFWQSRIGYFKLIIGLVIVSVLGLFQFIFPSDIGTYIASILFTSVLLFGLYLLLRSSIEKLCNASVQIIPIILITTVSIIIGISGLPHYQLLLSVFINPEMLESIILVTVLIHSTTFGSFTGLMLIYEALYKKSWSYNPAANVFIIKRWNPWVSMTEYIPVEYIDKITVTTIATQSQFGRWTLELHTKPPYKAKRQDWILQDRNAYLNLFSTVHYLTNHKLLDDTESHWLVRASNTPPPLSNEEKLIDFEERHPGFVRKHRESTDFKAELRKEGAIITQNQDNTTSIVFPSYRQIASKSFIINLSILLLVSVGMTYAYFRLLDIAYRSLTSSSDFFMIGGLMGLLVVFLWGLTINYVRRIQSVLSCHPVNLTFSAKEFSIKIRNRIEKYPTGLLANIMTKRDLFVGSALCLSKEFGKLPLFYLNNRKTTNYLVSYISKNALKLTRKMP